MDNLKEWTIAYVKNRDMAFRKLVSHHDEGNKVIFKFKDKEQKYVFAESLEPIMGEACDFLVTRNSEENFNCLIKNWDKLSKTKLSIIFVAKDDKWLINPHVHSMIADPASMKTGLRTMFETANGKIAEVKVAKKKAMFEESDEKPDEEN
jgi:hypothetical protein